MSESPTSKPSSEAATSELSRLASTLGHVNGEGGIVEAWKERPLAFAPVDESKSGAILVQLVSVREVDGVSMTGLWELSDPDNQAVRDLLTHRILIGTRDGIDHAEKILGHSIDSADLAGLVAACEEAEATLNDRWLEYRDEEPKKRVSLKPLAARSWPAVTEDGDAAKILKRVGRTPYPSNTHKEMRDIIALSRLVSYVIETWYDLETDRTSRSYLNEGDKERLLYPPEWLAQFQPYWPKVS